jgi:hypothetical protein
VLGFVDGGGAVGVDSACAVGSAVGRDPWAPVGAVGWRARLDGAEDPAVGAVVAALGAAALALDPTDRDAAALVGQIRARRGAGRP